jgi:hypothetical protein
MDIQGPRDCTQSCQTSIHGIISKKNSAVGMYLAKPCPHEGWLGKMVNGLEGIKGIKG